MEVQGLDLPIAAEQDSPDGIPLLKLNLVDVGPGQLPRLRATIPSLRLWNVPLVSVGVGT
jgi:hypothetical protein